MCFSSRALPDELRATCLPRGVQRATARGIGILASLIFLSGGCATPPSEPAAIAQPAPRSAPEEIHLLTGSRIPRAIEEGQPDPSAPFHTLVIDHQTLDTTGGFTLAEQLRRITPIVGR